jgi:hypothetical protein
MASGLIFQNGAWTLQYISPIPSGFMGAVFGNGSDGDLVVTGAYSLTRDYSFNNLTLTGTGSVCNAGYKLFVKNVLTINSGCSVNDDGVAGNNRTAGTALGARGYLNGNTSTGGQGSGGNTNGSAGAANATYNIV